MGIPITWLSVEVHHGKDEDPITICLLDIEHAIGETVGHTAADRLVEHWLGLGVLDNSLDRGVNLEGKVET